jgi:hypothetical protein
MGEDMAKKSAPKLLKRTQEITKKNGSVQIGRFSAAC